MTFELFDRVRIKEKDVVGTIVDIYSDEDNRTVYVVQSRSPSDDKCTDAYPGEYPLYDCTEENQLTKI